jgi:hypothetical protein
MAKQPIRSSADTDLHRQAAQERLRRIEVLGGFGAKRTQVVRNRVAYNRKDKNWKPGPQGPFAFGSNGSGGARNRVRAGGRGAEARA